MYEILLSRVKMTIILALFLAPVFVAVWDKQLDEWLRQSHRYEPLIPVSAVDGAVLPP
jgi:hypothetical protein